MMIKTKVSIGKHRLNLQVIIKTKQKNE